MEMIGVRQHCVEALRSFSMVLHFKWLSMSREAVHVVTNPSVGCELWRCIQPWLSHLVVPKWPVSSTAGTCSGARCGGVCSFGCHLVVPMRLGCFQYSRNFGDLSAS